MAQSPDEKAAQAAAAAEPTTRVHLTRTDENADEIAGLARLLGEPAGLDGLLEELKYTARPARLPRLLGRAVSRAWALDDHDQHDETWYPQGITTSADANDAEVIAADRRIVVLTWYSRTGRGSRLTFLDLDTLRYRHVLLVEPVLTQGRLQLEPVRIHAGGIVWYGPWLHVAATFKGFVTCRVDDIMRVEDDDAVPEQLGVLDTGRVASFGHHFVLPVRFRYRAHAEIGDVGLRYSFLSLDRSGDVPVLLAGEYGRGRESTRLVRYRLDPGTTLLETGEDGRSRPIGIDERGVRQMQGFAVARDRVHVSVSRGSWCPGSVYAGEPGKLREHVFATPMGPEDLSYWPENDSFWSVSEYPRRRWVYSMERSWFDRHRWLDRQAWARDVPLRAARAWKRLRKGRPGRRR